MKTIKINTTDVQGELLVQWKSADRIQLYTHPDSQKPDKKYIKIKGRIWQVNIKITRKIITTVYNPIKERRIALPKDQQYATYELDHNHTLFNDMTNVHGARQTANLLFQAVYPLITTFFEDPELEIEGLKADIQKNIDRWQDTMEGNVKQAAKLKIKIAAAKKAIKGNSKDALLAHEKSYDY